MEEIESSFEDLCMPHLDAAYNFARLLTGKDEDAQDVVQSAYVRALKGFNRFRGDDSRSWLLGIVRNAAYDRLKKHANKTYLVRSNPVAEGEAAGKPFANSSSNNQVQQLAEALNRLPVELREIVFLREIEGWSYAKLASILSMSFETVICRLSQARQRLRQEAARIEQKELRDEL